MASETIQIRLLAGEAHALCRAPSRALRAVDPARILPRDLHEATARFARLAQRAVVALEMAATEAEELLAACDAVWWALDAARIDSAELAVDVEDFRALRMLVHAACCAPRCAPAAVPRRAA